MNLLKKFVAGVASLSVALSTAIAAVPAANAGTPMFTDIGGHWAEPFIVELAESDIISTQNADGSAKTMFFPNNSLTRAELTKLAIEAFYGDTVSDLADAFADDSNPSFSDVSSTDWYFPYVEIAKGLDIVQGFADGTFAPNSPITRSATLKVILLTGDIETMIEPEPPFVDVAASDWSYEYVSTAFNHCIVSGTTPTTFAPNGNVTRAESSKILLNSIKVADGEDICVDGNDDDDDDDDDDDMEGNDDDDDDDDDSTPAPAGSLEVSVSSETPEGASIPKNGSNVPFLALDLTNNGDQDIEVTGVVVSHGGLGNENEIDDVKVFDGIKQRGTDRPFTSDEEIAPLNLASDPIMVKADTTKTIVIAADMSDPTDSGGEHRFSIASAEDITAVGAETGGDVEIVGDFPARGETMRVANVQVGGLDFNFKSVADDTIEVGETDVELARIEISESTGAEDVLLQAMSLEFDGVDDEDLGNLYVEFQGQRISNIVDTLSNEDATFDFTENDDGGWILEDGDNRTVRIKGDILSGVDETLTPQFDEVKSDVLAQGLTYGFGVNLTNTPDNTFAININGGDITFAFDSSSRDVAGDSDNVEFGILTISNFGEAVELKENMTLNLTLTPPGSATNSNTITDVRLVNVETGATFMGPSDAAAVASIAPHTADVAATVVFDDEVILETGEILTLSLQADIENTAVAGAKYKFALNMLTVDVEGVESSKSTTGGGGCAPTCNHDIRPSGNPSTKIYTIAAPTVTFTPKTLSADNYVSDAENVVVWQGTVRANSVEDVFIRSIEYTNGGTATDDDVDDYAIYKKEGNVLTPIETGEDPSATAGVTFSSLDEDGGTNGLLVPAGDEFTIVVTANIASNPTPNNTIQLTLAASGDVEAEDEDGDNATVAGNFPVPAVGTIFTIVNNGTLLVSVDNNKTDSMIVAAGLTDLPVGVFTFEATNENVEIEDLAVKVNEINTANTFDIDLPVGGGIEIDQNDVANDTDAVDSVALFYYDDGTAVKKTSGQAAKVNSIDSDNIALFQDLDLIIGDAEDTLIEVRVDLRDMDDSGSQATARSGMSFNVELVLAANAESTFRGVDSGDEIIAASVGAATVNGAQIAGGDATVSNPEVAGGDVTVELTGFAAGEFVAGDIVIIDRGNAGEVVLPVKAGAGTVDTVSIQLDLPANLAAGVTVERINAVDLNGFAAGEFEAGDYVIIDRGNAGEVVLQVGAGPGTVDTTSIQLDLAANLAGGETVELLATASSDSLFVFNNKVIAEASASQPSGALTTGSGASRKELLKFNLDFTGDTSDEPFLHEVVVNIEGTGGACVSNGVDDAGADGQCLSENDGNVSLWNGDNELIASVANDGTGTYILVVGTDAGGVGTLSTDIVADAGSANLSADPISINGETYTIRGDVYTDGADDAITATIEINGSGAGSDDIVWVDGGSTGSDGLAVQWIDLGASSSVTQIENTRSN